MSEPVAGGASAESVAQIVSGEQRRGSSAWDGPGGNADAWLLVTDFWNRTSYSTLTSLATSSAAIRRLG